VVTIDELAEIPLFSGLQRAELLRLAQTSADIHLAAGEYAVHEGDERAIYVVLAGKIEVTKVIDGVERTIGWRAPPQYFGEVPITLGTPFPGSYRASQPSRVMRVAARQYYAVAAAAPEISVKVARLHASASAGSRASRPRSRRRSSSSSGIAGTRPATSCVGSSRAIRSFSTG
jgi:thioredoxin reductase (NADPH)